MSAMHLRTPLLTWAALLVLTLFTSLIGLTNLGAWTPVIALVFSTLQASLIALFLMHGLRGPVLVRVAMAGGAIWFLIMMVLTMTDYLTRGWLLPSGK